MHNKIDKQQIGKQASPCHHKLSNCTTPSQDFALFGISLSFYHFEMSTVVNFACFNMLPLHLAAVQCSATALRLGVDGIRVGVGRQAGLLMGGCMGGAWGVGYLSINLFTLKKEKKKENLMEPRFEPGTSRSRLEVVRRYYTIYRRCSGPLNHRGPPIIFYLTCPPQPSYH